VVSTRGGLVDECLPNSELVTDALLMAFQRRRPDRRVVHHSDRGAAYTSLAFSQRVAELELDQSFGSAGDCYDNAAVEAFWATLKRELGWIHNTTTWANRADLRSALFEPWGSLAPVSVGVSTIFEVPDGIARWMRPGSSFPVTPATTRRSGEGR
jgi:transposase InsO family protein